MVCQPKHTGLKMNRLIKLMLASLLVVTLVLPWPGLAQSASAAGAVVHAVLFYSPTCPHCHKVMTEDLPPLTQKYGDQLQILAVDTTQPGGQNLFLTALQQFNIPPEQRGVPTLVVGDQVLIGDLDIPQKFPGLIEQYLAQGGVDWPNIPGLTAALDNPGSTADTGSSNDVFANLARDPAGNALAVIVLAGMLVVVERVTVTSLNTRPATPIRRKRVADPPTPAWRQWAVPALVAIGLIVAGYLTYVEAAHVEAVCGPVGDCNTVQQSEYARLFGVIPIGLLGLAGYVAVAVAWMISRYGQSRWADRGALALFAMTMFGTLFSIYLTFLEPFVIGATCMWCLTSAVVMTALLWLAAPGAKRAMANLAKR